MSTLKDLENVISMARRQAANTNGAELREVEELSAAVRRDPVDVQESIPGIIGEESEGDSDVRTTSVSMSGAENRLYQGDNLRLMKTLLEDDTVRGRIRMIYLDPPFYSKANYDAVVKVGKKNVRHPVYDDRWKAGLYYYLRQLTARLLLMRELLAEDGLIWLHLDWHVVHYAKVIMDEIFGESNFVNEIIWTYKSGGSSKRRFARKHDNILVYSKRPNRYQFFPLKEKSYNRELKPYHFKGVEEFRDETGWYTMVNMKDVWPIDMVGRTSAERTGYATQKPEQLLRRIIASSTKEGDLVADFFCGSGTLPAVAAKMGRRFLACDNESLAVESTLCRLSEIGCGVRVFAAEEKGKTETSRPRLEAEVRMVRKNKEFTGRKIVQLTLSGLREHRLARKMDRPSKDAVREAERSDPLELVGSWSVDYDFDGTVFRPDEIFIRRGDVLEIQTERIDDGTIGTILVRVVDVMGNVCYSSPAENSTEGCRPTENSTAESG